METPNFIESYQTNEFDFCDKVIDKLEEYLKIDTTAIMIGSQTNNGQANRVDYSVNFEALQDPLNVEMHQILNKYIVEYVNKYTGYAQRNAISRTMKVQKTPPKGGFHTWHSEHSSNNNSSYRVLTWTLYLNDIPEGEGETEFLEYGIKVQPVKGSLCFFPAAWTHVHRGNPVYTKTKYIATGWYYLTQEKTMARYTIIYSGGQIGKDGQFFPNLDLSWFPSDTLALQSPDGVTCTLEKGTRATLTNTSNQDDVATSTLDWWSNVDTTWQTAYDLANSDEGE